MFNKNIQNIIKIDLSIDKLYQYNDILLSSSFVEMMNNKHFNKLLEEKNNYQLNITSYHTRINENKVKKQYNPKIESLYYDGILVLENNEYKLSDFFIVFDDKLNNFHLKCIDSNFKTEEIEYNKAIKFIDTTAFINLINTSNIVHNKIIVNDINTLNDCIKNWDGLLHSAILETDSIINKKMIKDVENE